MSRREVEILYRAGQGAYVGVVTVHPSIDKYVFIHGPENPDERWHYDFHHRRGVVSWQGETHNLDAMDITALYPRRAARRQPCACFQPERRICQLYL
jgi:hypothetical protein